MSKKLSLVQVFILIFAVGLLTQCNAQDKKNETRINTNTAVAVSEPAAEEWKIDGNIPDYEIKETGLEYLQPLQVPDVYFVNKENNSKLQLPTEAKTILNTHWKEAIKFFYNEQYNKSSTAQEGYDRDTAWSNYFLKNQKKLQSISIETSSERRNISYTEAQKLLGFLNKAAGEVVKNFKQTSE